MGIDTRTDDTGVIGGYWIGLGRYPIRRRTTGRDPRGLSFNKKNLLYRRGMVII